MGILSRHLGKGEELKVGEDTILIKPLGTEEIPNFFKAMKAFSGAQEGATTENMLKNLDDAGLNAITHIINKTLKISLPDEPEEDRKQFGLRYMSQLLDIIFKINFQESDDQKRIAKIKKRLQK